MTWRTSVPVLLALLMLCCSASAELIASVSPKDPGKQVLSLYLDETGDYILSIANNGSEPARNVLVKASAADSLEIMDNGVGKSALGLKIDEIPAYGKETMLLTLKPVELSSNRLFLYVDYGIGDYTHLAATYLEVLQSPLEVNTTLSKTALDLGDEAIVKLSLKNSGSETIRNIRAELLVFQGLESQNGAVTLDSLAPGEGYEAKEFPFRADPSATGKRQLAMQVSFEDSLGRHVLEKGFFVEIQSKQAVMYIIAVIILLLVAVAVLSRRKDSKSVKKLEKPIVQEVDGTKVKPA